MQGTRRQQWAGPGARGGALAAGARVSPGKSGAEGGRDQAPNANAGAAHLPGQDRLLAQRASGGLRAASPQGWEVAASAESDTGGTRDETCPARLAPLACQPGPSSSLTLQSL